MTEYTVPKLVMGHIEVVAPDGEPGIPYDEAVIHLEGDEDSEIEVRQNKARAAGDQVREAYLDASLARQLRDLEATRHRR